MPPDLERILKWIIMSILLTVAAEFLSSPCYHSSFVIKSKNPVQLCGKIEQKARKDCTRMGNYLNPDNSKFQRAVNSDIYED